ncbi:hypothetical protein HPB48_009599 [Haemaphysalis longicornis]|uniref:LEM domain-containing protein n=1 Tax=Haemaphysalis longicornis TaxID=44386 RepID=A0A9J6FUH4_HAELO|nr:hypothetical protein HPB48_009599 [Haemaphysalis longicornis]
MSLTPSSSNAACSLLRSDIVLSALKRNDSVLLDKLVRLGSATGFALPDAEDKSTLLHVAVSQDVLPDGFVEKLLQNGVDPNATTTDGVTALHIAAAFGKDDALLQMVSRGGDPRLRDICGNDVFSLLAENGHLECLRKVQGLLGLPVTNGTGANDAADVVASPRVPAADCSGMSASDRSGLESPGCGEISPVLSTPSDTSTDSEAFLNTAYAFPHPFLSPVYLDNKRYSAEAGDSFAYEPTSSSEPADNSGDAAAAPSDTELEDCCGQDVGPVLESNRMFHLHALAHYRLGPRARVRLTASDVADAPNAANRPCACCEVVHSDPETGLAFKEAHYHSSSDAESSGASSGPENAPVEVPPELRALTNEEIFERLKSLGDAPGPVTNGTRAAYLNLLARLSLGLAKLHRPRDVLTPDIHTLVTRAGQLESYRELEEAMVRDFDAPRPKGYWREGNVKGFFTYLLLDSRVTQNLPLRAHGLTLAERMADFVKAVFYIGKGKRSRPFSHLSEALLVRKGLDKPWKKNNADAEKTRKILQIWDSRHGVVSLHVFQNTLAAEAYTREACMIDAIGIRHFDQSKEGRCLRRRQVVAGKEPSEAGCVFGVQGVEHIPERRRAPLGPT